VLTLTDLSEENQAEALINLGCIYSIQYKYKDAASCFGKVVKSGVIKKNPRFYPCLIFLAITYAKLGEFEASLSTLDKTVKDYPKQTKQIRTELWNMRIFQNVVKNEPSFRKNLEERIPVLFAS